MKTTLPFPKTILYWTTTLVLLCFPASSRAALVAGWGNNIHGQTRLPAGVSNIKAIAGGENHSLALRSDGSVVAWGMSNWGQINVPPGLTHVKAIAAGDNHNLALKVDGTVVEWGSSFFASTKEQTIMTNVPASLSNVTAIAAGTSHNLALKVDGTVVAWGDNYAGEADVPADLSGVVSIAAGGRHSLALKADGSVVAWGRNFYGETNVPSKLSEVVAITASETFNLALKADGTVVAWGWNDSGQTNVPPGLSNVTAIAAGVRDALALTTDGTVIAWGGDGYSQSVLPPGLSNVTAIAKGGYHSLALVTDGPIQIVQSPVTQGIPYTSNVTFSVAATGYGSFGYQWYFNGSPMGANNIRMSGITNAVLTITNLQFSDIGTYAVVVSNAFGSVFSSAAVLTVISPPFITQQPTDRAARAGSDIILPAISSGTPPLHYQWNFNGTDIPGATNAILSLVNVQPNASGLYFMRVTNLYGQAETIRASLTVTDSPPFIVRQPFAQLPDQITLTSNILVPIGGSLTLNFLARGSTPLNLQWRFNGMDLPGATNSTLALTRMGYDQTGYYNVEASNAFGVTNSTKVLVNVSHVYVWDSRFTGNPDMPVGISNVIAVAAGMYQLVALRSDGTVKSWGLFYGLSPALTNVPPTATNVMAIASGDKHSLALRRNGTIVAWGDNSYGQTNIPVGLSNVMAVAGGTARSFAVRSNGTVVGWGWSANVPEGLSNIVAVAAGRLQNLALKQDGTIVSWGIGAAAIVPVGLSNVIAIAAGEDYNMALMSDGSVSAWGTSSLGATTVPSSLSNAVAIACGSSYSLALRSDGILVDWGYTRRSSVSKIGLSNVVAVALNKLWESEDGIAVIGDGSPSITLDPYSQFADRSHTVVLHARAVGVQPMSYQWQFENQNLPGATNADLTITNVQGKNTGGYRMIASNALGTAASQIARISIPFNTNLPSALNTNNWFWSSADGRTSSIWFAQNRETHDGEVAAQSGVIANNQQSVLQATITGPGTLRFWWKVSSEEYFDLLSFYPDPLPDNRSTPLFSISGENDWEQHTIHISSGSHVLRWVYSKDVSVNAGRDAGWLDEVFFTPDPPVITRQPEPNLILPAGASAGYKFEVSGVGPFSYQWFKDGSSLLGATQAFIFLPNVNRRSSGTYRVQASNAGGSVMSSNAVLKVIVRQRMGSIHRATDGSLEIPSRDADGGELIPSDLPSFEAQASTNLIHWQTLPDALSVTNGSLLLRDLGANHWPQRFYRVVEH